MIEASFQAVYGIDLMEEIDYMSWRRFLTLLVNMPLDSAYMTVLRSRMNKGDAEQVITDYKQAERFIERFW